MQLASAARLTALALALALTAPLAAQSRTDLTALVKADVEVAKIRDSIYAQLSAVANKKDAAQVALREKMQADVDAALTRNGLTRDRYQRLTFAVGTDTAVHRLYDSIYVAVSGKPLDTQIQAARAAQTAAAGARGGRGAAVPVPAGPAGTHIGHVVNSFAAAPSAMGLLPAAMAEAATAAQHATLGARNPGDLAMMQLHAGHVIHALDPTVVNMGPGLGYGMKAAALGAADHIELAAKATGASANIQTHAVHIATASRQAAKTADEAIGIAKQIQSATSAADAAALMTKLIAATAQITAGADVNGDGKVDWQDGGLQQAQSHVTLLLNGER